MATNLKRMLQRKEIAWQIARLQNERTYPATYEDAFNRR